MTLQQAIKLIETGSKFPNVSHTAEQVDEAAMFVCKAAEKYIELSTWNDTIKSTPKDIGEYLCVVEYDFDKRHEITKRLLYWDGQSWSGMGRDTDVVTYWQDSIDKPTDEHCSGCMWPIQWCKCGR